MSEPRTKAHVAYASPNVLRADAIRELADKRIRQAEEYRRAQQPGEARMLELIAGALRDVADVVER